MNDENERLRSALAEMVGVVEAAGLKGVSVQQVKRLLVRVTCNDRLHWVRTDNGGVRCAWPLRAPVCAAPVWLKTAVDDRSIAQDCPTFEAR